MTISSKTVVERGGYMLSYELGAAEIINPVIEQYEKHFKTIFPLYDYLDETQSEMYDVSLIGSKKLAEFINQRIASDEPVALPEGYEQRQY